MTDQTATEAAMRAVLTVNTRHRLADAITGSIRDDLETLIEEGGTDLEAAAAHFSAMQERFGAAGQVNTAAGLEAFAPYVAAMLNVLILAHLGAAGESV